MHYNIFRKLSNNEHVKNILTICYQRCYLLKCLKAQGLPAKQLNVVFSAIVVSRIIYALPAWGGFLSNDLIAKLDAFFKKAFRWGYSCDLRRLSVLSHEADEHLFHKIVNNKDHCIHQLLPPEKILPMKLLATNCIFALPQCHYNLYKRSFVLRYLFGDAD